MWLGNKLFWKFCNNAGKWHWVQIFYVHYGWRRCDWIHKRFEPDDEFETMLQHERIDISKGIDIDKTSALKECMICHHWYFKDIEFKFKSNICNKYHGGCIFSRHDVKCGISLRFWRID